MESNGSLGSMGGSGSSMTNLPQGPSGAQMAEYNQKRGYGNFSGGWLAFAGIAVFIILLIVFGNIG